MTVINKSQFFAGDRYPEVRFTVDVPGLNTFFGQNMSSTGGRRVRFRLEQVLSDGRVFTNSNSSSIIRTGTFWSSPYEYTTRFLN
jgi:hypothetical protein